MDMLAARGRRRFRLYGRFRPTRAPAAITTTATTTTTTVTTTSTMTSHFVPLVETVFLLIEAYMTDEVNSEGVETENALSEPPSFVEIEEASEIGEAAEGASTVEDVAQLEVDEQPMADASPAPVFFRDGQLRLVGGRTENEVKSFLRRVSSFSEGRKGKLTFKVEKIVSSRETFKSSTPANGAPFATTNGT